MRKIPVLQVFVASPSDVQVEREALEATIAEVNQLMATTSGIRLELVKWESLRPGFGADPQDVINRQVRDDYDIFIGILWTRFGAPTPRAESGTEEEFNRAYKRFQNDPRSVSIMVYFKEEAINPDSIDLAQLAAVRAFRKKVPELGGLYGTFRTTEEFLALLRLHLVGEAAEWQNREAVTSLEVPPSEAEVPSVADTLLAGEELTEGLGFLDHLAIAEEKFEEAAAAVVRIGEALGLLTERLNQRTAEIDKLAAKGPPYDARAGRRIAKRTAEDMEQFVSRATVETPLMSNALQEAMQSFGSAASYLGERGPSTREELLSALENVTGLRGDMEVAASSLADLRSTTASFPRIQQDMNSAKRRSLAALDKLLVELQADINLAQALETSIQRLLDEPGTSS